MREDKTQKDLRALGQLVEGTEAEVVFFLTPLISGKSAKGTDESILSTCVLKTNIHQLTIGFFDHVVDHTAPGMLDTDGVHLSERGKRILACELIEG